MYFTGDDAWPPGCSLKFVAGEQFGTIDRAMVDALQPGAVTDVSVDMISPSSNGMFQGQWRMTTPTGMYFGGENNSFVYFKKRDAVSFKLSHQNIFDTEY